MRTVTTTCIALIAFVLGVLSCHPVAGAFTQLAVTACKSTAACTGGNNSSTGAGVYGEATGIAHPYGVNAPRLPFAERKMR